MIPKKLMLKNFLSYGPTQITVDFSEHQYICLTGKNGHGKSALLDAITWALWGQARKMNGVARADEHLVHLGQDNMIVTFDFDLHGATYRVTREYSKLKHKKTLSELQFGIFNVETNSFIPKTGKTTRETQEQIIETISLTFEDCSNSIFLRQGQSHEFSKKSPQERKEILSSILGFTHLDAYRNTTLAVLRELTKQEELLKERIEQLQENTTLRTSLKADQQMLFAQLRSCAEEQATLELAIAKTEKDQELYYYQQKEHALLFQEETAYKKALQQISQELHTAITEWKTIRSTLRNTPAISVFSSKHKQQLEEQLYEIAQLKEKITTTLQEKQQIQEQLLSQEYALENCYTETIQKLSLTYQALDLTTKHKQAQSLSHTQEIKTIAMMIAELETILLSQPTIIQKLEQKNILLYNLRQTLLQIEKKIYSATSDLEKLLTREEQVQNACGTMKLADANCPTCQQVLTTALQQTLIHKYQKEEHAIQHTKKRQQQYLRALKNRLDTLEKIQTQERRHLEQLTQQVNLGEQKRAALITLEKNSEELTSKYNGLQRELQELLNQKHVLEQQKQDLQATYEVQKQALKSSELFKKLTSYAALVESYKSQLQRCNEPRITEQLKQLTLQEKNSQNTALLRQTKKSLAGTIKKYITQLRTLRNQNALLVLKREQLHLVEPITDQQNTLKELRANLTENINKQATITGQERFIQAKLDALEKEQKIVNELQITHQALLVTIDDYQILAGALSKNGIQALLIESILPELEQETNAILTRLTENNTQILFESVKDLKNGTSKETLDIHISDAMGVRPYELFSGGEAFRIDFALRIALSKLLAKRSGKPLQTLIIDEGFGSQDEQGLEKILEALQKIQSDFSKIIIVSHLPVMKAQFSTNFLIEKHPTGSQVTVIEQW